MSGFNAQMGFDCLDDFITSAAAELTWCLIYPPSVPQSAIPHHHTNKRERITYCRANLQMEFAHRRPIIHSIKRSHLIHPHRRHLQDPSHLIHNAQTGESMLSLSQIQNGHDSRLLVLWWIALEDLVDELVILVVELEGDFGIIDRRVAMLQTKS